MDNVDVEIREDGKVALVFDPKVRLGPSASGKTIVIASTRGNKQIETPNGDVTVGLNVYIKR